MAADSAQTANSVNYSMVALELLAELQLQRNDLPAARSTIDTMSAKLKLIPTDKDAEMQHAFLQARLDTEAGDLTEAQTRLQLLFHEATQTKDKEMLLRIKLAQGQLNERKGQGICSLQAAVKEARQDGFELLARSVT